MVTDFFVYILFPFPVIEPLFLALSEDSFLFIFFAKLTLQNIIQSSNLRFLF